ncbi:hypothetical protein BFP72_13445 [Reichenbachiella sp. 5M10]|uniref:tetratricopeptide repeat protein n=1 Tax=Reichenbachiella sp. 5M10 TaxID=1889772 RepID=UPI000C1611D4|nr:tetratricopeptide repeat protein [Reichenbachiella sp. 5M10]PIB36327.1 hypothetical protein BFP72_13445 [Reichenbachiella sp. 5M10]
MNKSTLFFVLCALVFQSCLKIENAGTNDGVVLESDTISHLVRIEDVNAPYTSLGGRVLTEPDLDRWTRLKRENQLEEAFEDYQTYPDSVDMIIWYGRRLSYLYRYHEAINVYSSALLANPNSYQLYRHRGHRYLTIRKMDEAIADLERAAFFIRKVPLELEPDGIPNDSNVPRSTVQFNIWYHLGLAYYIKGNFDKAVSAYKKCLLVADNHDMLVSASNWLYMTYRKIGNVEAAVALLEPIHKDMNIMENFQYHELLLMYKGEIQPHSLYDVETADQTIAQLTTGYGVGNWYYYNGKTDDAMEVFKHMMNSPYWQSFGYLGAEMELLNTLAVEE